MWTAYLCDTVTGDPLARLDTTALQAMTWERKLNGIGTGTCTLVMDGIGSGSSIAARRDDRRKLLTAWSRTVVLCWSDETNRDETIVYAGVFTNPGVQRQAGTVTFDHAEGREFLKHRTTFGATGYEPKRIQKFTNESHASLAGRLIRMAAEGPRSNYALPWVMPGVGMAGTEDRTWADYNTALIEDELVEVQDDAGGPDIDFLARWSSAGRLEWVPRVGQLSGPTLDWNLTAPDSGVAGLDLAGNKTEQANVIYATGDGSEVKLLVRSAWATTDVPALERVESFSQLKNGRALQSHADAELLARQNPPSDWPLSIRADGAPGVRDLVLGQQHRVYTMDDPWIYDGWKDDLRLIGYSGDLTNTVALQLQ